MRSFIWFIAWAAAISATGCSTLNDSLQLGAGMGMATGAAAGKSTRFGDVAIGAGVGSALGLLTSYLVHRSVETDRKACEAVTTEVHFGDLPPSPFIVPTQKKGNH